MDSLTRTRAGEAIPRESSRVVVDAVPVGKQ